MVIIVCSFYNYPPDIEVGIKNVQWLNQKKSLIGFDFIRWLSVLNNRKNKNSLKSSVETICEIKNILKLKTQLDKSVQ